jgi:glycosyltransferase involved in cell wall biosynthesis
MFAIPSALSGLALAKRFRLPHVLSILGGDVYDPSKRLSPHRTPLLRYTVKKIMEWSDVVVALSADISKKAAKYYKVSREIKIHHLGIIEPRFQKIGRECLNFKESDLLLITIGRLVRRKSVEHLIEVIKMLNDKQVKLIVIGDGPERTKLQKLAGDSSVSDRVFFFGNVSDEEKFQLLSLADVYLSSSQHEGFGIVFLEAMMSRLPVVSYDEGGHVEFLIHEKTGFLVQHGKIGELTARTKELCDDETLRKEMGRFNEEYVKQFSIRNCAKKYQWVYDSLLEGASTCLLLSSALTLSAE